MDLDVNTLFLVTIYVDAMLGLLLLFVWAQNSSIKAVAWWGFAHLLLAASIVLFGLYGSVPDLIAIDLANTLLFTAFAIIWTGARVFDGREPVPMGLIAGAAFWLVVCRRPVVIETIEIRALISSGIITSYTWLTAYEFWRGRSEPLVSRWPVIFMLFAHGALFLLRTPFSQILPWTPNKQVFDSVWLSVLSFEALLFTIATAFILLAMAKERTELRHKTAALVDPLTNIANRRAFFEGGAQLARRYDASPRPTAVLLIDLDHFKHINDTYGHGIGDRVLRVFAETAAANLGAFDLLGRLGGEEFSAVLIDAGRETAMQTAERIRAAFADVASEIDGQPINATVSIGVAFCEDGPLDVPALLVQADQALYYAKERGRNRVEAASLELVLRPEGPAPSLRIGGLKAKSAA
jgi:diguanylate cyclase (GGDEF)-like protein